MFGKHTCTVTVNSFNNLEFLMVLALLLKAILYFFRRFYKLNAKNALCADDVRSSVRFCLSVCDLISGTKSFLG